MTDTTRQAAYEAGRQARRDGRKVYENPHSFDTGTLARKSTLRQRPAT